MRKNVLNPFQLLSSQALTSDFVSPSTNIQYLDNIAFELSWNTADCVGAFYVQGSVSGQSWTNLDINPTAVTSTPDSGFINLTGLAFPLIRIKYVFTSGTAGTVNVFISGKES